MTSSKFDKLSENAQDIICQVFGEIEDRQYEGSIGIDNFDFDQEPVDDDTLVGEEDDGEAEASHLGDAEYATLFETADWEVES